MARHSLYLTDDLAAEAEQFGLNITRVCQEAIRDAVRSANRPYPSIIMPSDTETDSHVIVVSMENGNVFRWEMSSAEADAFIRAICDEPIVQRLYNGTQVILRTDAIAWTADTPPDHELSFGEYVEPRSEANFPQPLTLH